MNIGHGYKHTHTHTHTHIDSEWMRERDHWN